MILKSKRRRNWPLSESSDDALMISFYCVVAVMLFLFFCTFENAMKRGR